MSNIKDFFCSKNPKATEISANVHRIKKITESAKKKRIRGYQRLSSFSHIHTHAVFLSSVKCFDKYFPPILMTFVCLLILSSPFSSPSFIVVSQFLQFVALLFENPSSHSIMMCAHHVIHTQLLFVCRLLLRRLTFGLLSHFLSLSLSLSFSRRMELEINGFSETKRNEMKKG